MTNHKANAVSDRWHSRLLQATIAFSLLPTTSSFSRSKQDYARFSRAYGSLLNHCAYFLGAAATDGHTAAVFEDGHVAVLGGLFDAVDELEVVIELDRNNVHVRVE